MSSSSFDRVAYKRTTTDQWQNAAESWHRWAPTLEAWLGAATELMLDLAGVGPGARVLDVAAGAGGQTLAAARRVGPEGHVLATDIASNILAFAERNARAAGLHNVEVRVLDGEQLDGRHVRSTRSSRASASSTSPTSTPRSPGCATRCGQAGAWPASSTPRPRPTASSRSRYR
jgi:tRNA G46 methylase TrmB